MVLPCALDRPDVPRNPAIIGHGTLKMLSGNWNSGRLSGFSPDNFHLRETSDVSEIYDSRPGWVGIAGDRRVCAKPGGTHRQRHHEAGGCVGLIVPGHLAGVETC